MDNTTTNVQGREIKTFDEFPKYMVGSDGSVWSTDYNHTGKMGELKQHFDEDGYKYVFLVIDGNRYKRRVNRMVAITFIENPLNKPQVNHKNGVRDDNRVENLNWMTNQENAIHGWRVNGRKATQKQRDNAKISARIMNKKRWNYGA